MMKKVVWIVVALLLTLWTVFAWVSVRLLQWVGDLLSEGGKTGPWLDLLSNWSVPSWLMVWVDAQQIQAAQLALVKLAEHLAGSWPGFGKVLTGAEPLVWAVWVAGLVVILLPALLANWLVSRQARADAAVKAG